MIEALLAKLELRDRLHPEERVALAAGFGPTKRYEALDTLVQQGARPDESTLLVEGLTARVTTVRDGGQQITSLHIPGDFVDLHSFLLRTMDHSIVAMSGCTITNITHVKLRDLTSRFPHLGRLLWLSTLIDAAIHRQWLVAMGRLTALGQLAHLICEQSLRLKVVELAADYTFGSLLTQARLADVLGTSEAHVNRALSELRARGLIKWSGTRVEILDWAGLVEVGEFDPTYLQLETMPV
jgi:CRP-like cAMP-binding protein